MKQFVFRVSPSFHQRVKIAAAKKNETMALYICKAIEEALKKDEVSNEDNTRRDTIKQR